jgi:hypothetical protein
MYKEDVITAEECMNYLFNDMDEFQKFKFILSSNDLDICKICILGVNKLYYINQDLKGKL